MLWNNYGSLAAKTFENLKSIYNYSLEKADDLLSTYAEEEGDEGNSSSDSETDESDSDESDSSDDSEDEASNETSAKKKVVRDPNAPKKPPTSYFLFLKEVRAGYKQLHPGYSTQEIIERFGRGMEGSKP